MIAFTNTEKESIELLLEIPDDRRIAEAYSRGQAMVDALPEMRQKFLSLMERIRENVEGACAKEKTS